MTLYYSLVCPTLLPRLIVGGEHRRRAAAACIFGFVAIGALFRSLLSTMLPSSSPYCPQARHVAHILTVAHLTGILPSSGRGGHLLRSHRPAALHMAPQTLHLHLGKPSRREAPIWHEGKETCRLTTSPVLTSGQITFIFITILFIDSVNRVYRVQLELAAFAKSEGRGYVYAPQYKAKHR